MFKNSVFKVSVDTKKWLKATAIRAIKTTAQTAAGMFTVGMAANEVSWGHVASVALVAGAYSIVTSLAGIPEVAEQEEN